MLTVLERNPHLQAAEIFEHATEICSTINLSTVYRTLSLLHDLGVVEAAGFGEPHRHFESHRAAHYHAVCQECGAVLEFPPTSALAKLAATQGFDIAEERVELIGICKACRRKKEKNPIQQVAVASRCSVQSDDLADEFTKLRPGSSIELVAADDRELETLLTMAHKTGIRLTRVRARNDGMHLWMQRRAGE